MKRIELDEIEEGDIVKVTCGTCHCVGQVDSVGFDNFEEYEILYFNSSTDCGDVPFGDISYAHLLARFPDWNIIKIDTKGEKKIPAGVPVWTPAPARPRRLQINLGDYEPLNWDDL